MGDTHFAAGGGPEEVMLELEGGGGYASRVKAVLFRNPVPIKDGVFQIRALGARVTVLVDGGDVLLVDAGLRGSSGVIARGLGAFGLSVGQVRRVVVTHAHPDHSGGLSELVAGREIAVAVHRLEADILEGRAPAPSPLQNALLATMARPIISRLMGGPVAIDDHLEDGDTLPFGTEVRVIHLPGHTPGSIGLYLPERRLLIPGDALQYKLGWRLSPPAPGVTQRPKEAMRSLERLLDLDFDTICFSHFPPMRDEPRKALRTLVQRHAA